MPHSCRVVDLDRHFAGADPVLRATFDAYLAAAREHGPVTVTPTKSRISFQARMRFASILAPRKTFLMATFVLTRAVRSERLANSLSSRSSAAPRQRLQERPPERVAEREEDQDRQRHDDRDERDHRQHARAAVVVHSALALRAPGSDSSSATR